MSAVIQTALEIKVNETLTWYIILENQMRRVKFSLQEKKGDNWQTREEWYTTRTDGMRLAMFLAGIKDVRQTLGEREEEDTFVDRPWGKQDKGDD